MLRILIVAGLLLPNVIHAQETLPPDRYAKQLDPILERTMQETKVPGLAVGVVENGKLVFSRGLGLMKLGDVASPITPKTLFHMASVTKTFVAASVMQLVEQKKIDLDAPVKKYLPYFSINDQRLEKVTVRQMLSHTSGMPDTDYYGWDKPQYDEQALERYVRSLSNLKLLADPGTKFAYSNIAYEVLGDLVAKVSQQSFEAYVEEHLLTPVGMKTSTLLVKNADAALLASGHTKTGQGPWQMVQHYPYNRAHTPSSNLHSNIEDMARWIMFNLNRGELDGKRLLADTSFEVMWKPVIDIKPPEKMGLCWFLNESKGERMIKHFGSDDGFLTAVLMFPDKRLGIIILINSDNAPLRYLIQQSIAVALGRTKDIDLK
ncbi:MAG TPA: serine hydrolase domain-containing protein [Gemmatales bacterium]|nr:serine hydrolase domain-containing protein [Gemmatales bacterium]